MKKFLLMLIAVILIATLCSGLIGCSDDLANDNQDEDLNLPPEVTNANEESGTNRLQEAITTNETLVLSDINSRESETEQSSIDLADYSLIERSGKHYIVFDNILEYQDNGQNQELANVKFKSIAEFKDTVTNGKLTNGQKSIIAKSFKKDENGVLICDLDKLFEAKLPNEFKIDSVYWEGETYSFSVSTSSEVYGGITVFPQHYYDERYNKDFENYFNQPNVRVEESFKTEDGKTVVTYMAGGFHGRRIRYEYSIEDKTIVVDETYALNISENVILVGIDLYCEEPDAHYIVNLFGSPSRPSNGWVPGALEKPTESWICEFGLKPYVDLEAAEK